MTKIAREIQAAVQRDLERIREVLGSDADSHSKKLERYRQKVLKEQRDEYHARKKGKKK